MSGSSDLSSTLAVGGLASGLDTASIVAALMAVEQQPRTRLQQQSTVVQARSTALQGIQTQLKNLGFAIADLRLPSLYNNTQSVDSSDPTKVVARRVSGAGTGGYQVEVTRLARAEQRTFGYTPDATNDTTITVGGHATTITAGSTVDQAVDAVNSDASAGVYAAAVNGNLVLSSRVTGAAGTFTATGSTIVEDGSKAMAGQDASFAVDGIPMTSGTNVVTSGIAGVELTLRATTSSAITINVGQPAPSVDAIKNKVKAFVAAYNTAIDAVRTKTGEAVVPNAQTDAERIKGVLRGDPDLNHLLFALRSGISSPVAGNPIGTQSFADIGVSTGAASGSTSFSADSVAGHLVIDDTKLTAALQSNPAGVRQMLGGLVGTDGMAQRLETILTPETQSGGIIASRIQSAAASVSSLADAITSMNDRLKIRETTLRAQFTNLEKILGQSQSQGAWLSSQLAALNR